MIAAVGVAAIAEFEKIREPVYGVEPCTDKEAAVGERTAKLGKELGHREGEPLRVVFGQRLPECVTHLDRVPADRDDGDRRRAAIATDPDGEAIGGDAMR